MIHICCIFIFAYLQSCLFMD